MIGDGSLRHEPEGPYLISFEMTDKNILSLIKRSFREVFGLGKPIKIVKRPNGRKSYLLRYSNKIVYYFLNRFFELTPNKAKTVAIPKNLAHLGRNMKIAFLLGLYHTDGSLSNGNLRFYTSSRRLKDDVNKMLSKLGYQNRIYAYQRKNYDPEYHVLVKDSNKLLAEFEKLEPPLRK